MLTRTKIISIVMLLMGLFSVVFLVTLSSTQQHALDKLINTKVHFANLLAKNVLQQAADRYQKRIKGFINYKSVKTKELFVNALAHQDRESLLHLTQPFLEIFQKENPYFTSLSWILPDNTVILRVQKPELFGDNILKFLPDVVEANLTKAQFHGFGVARSGMQYRIVEPVVYEGRHVGVVLFGLKASFISDMLEKQLDVPSGLAILNKECAFAVYAETDGLKGNTHTVRVSDKKIFDILPKNIDWSQQRHDFQANDRNYILLNLFPLKNFIGTQLGRYFIILDVTEEREAASRILYGALIVCCLLLVLSFVVIYVGYNALVQKIVNLNKTLKKNNLELEYRVSERTTDLQERESQLRQIIDLVPHFIFVKDETGKFEIVNKATAEVFGTTVEDLTGRKDVEFVANDEEMESFWSDDFEVIKSGKIKFIPEEKITDSENKTRYLQTTKVPFKISGTEVSALLGIAVDITDRKQTEQQIIRLNHLREELLGLGDFNEKLIHITDAVVDIFDADFCRVWIIKSGDRCNDSCPHAEATEGPHVCLHRERCLHLAASSGRYSGLDSTMHGRVPFGCYKIGMIASGAIESFNTNDVTHDSRVHDREWAKKLGMVSFAGYCLFSDNGLPIGVIALFSKHVIDPHEVGLLEGVANSTSQVIQMAMAATEKEAMRVNLHRAQKMEAIGLMASGVAHDLNNILAGIVSYPELLLLKLSESSELRKPIEEIRESGKRAATVVADLLTVARGAASTKVPCDVNVLIQDYLDSPECSKLKYLHPGVICTNQLNAENPIIACSSVHIKKTIMNLLTNAMEALGKKGNVVIATCNQTIEKTDILEKKIPPGNYVLITVRDDGSGIAPKDLNHIFEPFYTKKIMGRSGTGLGLSIVWNTVQDHNGEIFVESNEKGSIFQLYFPLSTEEIINDCPEANTEQTFTTKGTYILVVDDEPQIRDIATQLLKVIGYKVDSVCSGELAIAFVKDNPVDLIVMDMLMEPGMNGRQTYAEILKLYPDQKAIVTSGFSESTDIKATLDLGANGFIKKPYSMASLDRAVKEALNK